MTNKNNEEHTTLNSDNLFFLIIKKRKIFISVTILAVVLSSIASLLIQNKYKSSVILFPTTTSSISKALLTVNNNKSDILKFGEEEEVEQMLQILHSDEIRTKIIEKYNLLEHYNIKEDDQYKFTKLQKSFDGNVSFSKTKFMSIEIEVMDHSADTAALIANDIASLIDSVKNRMQHEMALEAFVIVEHEYKEQQKHIKSLEESLVELSKYGVVDYESQAERITEQLAISILQGKQSATKKLEDKLLVLGQYGGAYLSIRNQLEFEIEELTVVHAKYKELKVDVENTLQHKFVVNHAYPAEKKAYPIRWLIVFISTLATLFLTMLFVFIKENLNNYKL